MVAKANIVVNDRETTPVAHTFVPDSLLADGPGMLFAEQNGGIASGARTLAVRTKRTRKDKQMVVELMLRVPTVVTETINGQSRLKIERTNWATVQFSWAPLSTLQERKNVVGMIYNALASSQTMLDAVLTTPEGIV